MDTSDKIQLNSFFVIKLHKNFQFEIKEFITKITLQAIGRYTYNKIKEFMKQKSGLEFFKLKNKSNLVWLVAKTRVTFLSFISIKSV